MEITDEVLSRLTAIFLMLLFCLLFLFIGRINFNCLPLIPLQGGKALSIHRINARDTLLLVLNVLIALSHYTTCNGTGAASYRQLPVFIIPIMSLNLQITRTLWALNLVIEGKSGLMRMAFDCELALGRVHQLLRTSHFICVFQEID